MNKSDHIPLFELRDVTRHFTDGNVHALRGISLTIHPGEFVAIVGPSGSGKSTLLNLLGGLDTPNSGEIFFRGEPITKHTNLDRFRSRVLGFVFQSFHLIPTLTAKENVIVPMFEGPKRSSREKSLRAIELLESVGLESRMNHRPNQLSVGERQRLALARSLANDPEVLLADEPTGNLDHQNAEDVMGRLLTLKKDRGLTIILITHSMELAARADRIIAIRDGNIIEDRPRISIVA
jgi:putative ABC transport system ATP-binding protein